MSANSTIGKDVLLLGLERWDRCLQETLAPAILRLQGWPGVEENEFVWRIDAPVESRADIRIPVEMVEAAGGQSESVVGGFAAALLICDSVMEKGDHD